MLWNETLLRPSPASWRADLPSRERRLYTEWSQCPWRPNLSGPLCPPSEYTHLKIWFMAWAQVSKCLFFLSYNLSSRTRNTLVMAAEMESIKPGSRFRKPVPSCFLMLSNTTVLAGMFTPIAKVSVANSTWERKGRCRQLVELFLFANEGECSK